MTSMETLKKYPSSRLALLADSKPTYVHDGLPFIFIDRDPQFFNIILHFCRDGHRNINCNLPSDNRVLRQVYTEAEYYQLDSLADIIASQLCVLLMGHKNLEE